MKTVPFSMESVLQLRAAAKEQAEKALALALRDRDETEDRLKEAQRHLDGLVHDCRAGTFTAVARQQGWSAICRQEEICLESRAFLDKADAIVVARRVELVVAGIDHELVVRLRKKWLEARVYAEAHAEERQLEDFVNARRGNPLIDR